MPESLAVNKNLQELYISHIFVYFAAEPEEVVDITVYPSLKKLALFQIIADFSSIHYISVRFEQLETLRFYDNYIQQDNFPQDQQTLALRMIDKFNSFQGCSSLKYDIYRDGIDVYTHTSCCPHIGDITYQCDHVLHLFYIHLLNTCL